MQRITATVLAMSLMGTAAYAATNADALQARLDRSPIDRGRRLLGRLRRTLRPDR